MITPFTADGRIDYRALGRMIDYVIDGGVDYIVALGTTAETPTLYMPERAAIALFMTDHIAGRVPLVMGVGGNSTSEVLDQLREFDLRGADAILSVTPYYNKPSQEGLYQHFRTVAEHSPLPVILYNIPGRSGVNMTAETTLRLACDFIRAGAPVYGVYPDWNCPVEGGFIPDCGSIAALVKASTGVQCEFFGKPSPHTLRYMLKHTGCQPQEMAVVGDRLYTDIAVAAGTEVLSILVMSGETTPEMLASSETKPDLTVENIGRLAEML